jgi:UDP-3-O-[3-hydroxymyristoyl] glucosamine N-acyltransferase
MVQYTSRTPWAKVSNYLKKELSVVGENVDMAADKSVIFKQCFIGNHCKIGQKSKLNNCVIMDNVVIGDK